MRCCGACGEEAKAMTRTLYSPPSHLIHVGFFAYEAWMNRNARDYLYQSNWETINLFFLDLQFILNPLCHMIEVQVESLAWRGGWEVWDDRPRNGIRCHFSVAIVLHSLASRSFGLCRVVAATHTPNRPLSVSIRIRHETAVRIVTIIAIHNRT